MDNIGIFKSEENILLHESFHGFLKIFVNLSIGAVSAKLGMLALAEGNKITAICYGVVAGILLVLALGYLLINIVGKTMKSFEIKAAKIVGDGDVIVETEKKLLAQQVSLGIIAFITVAGLYALGAWSLSSLVIGEFF
ncbi:MAG: hypothetical protein ACC707_12175 [Thiohalomonadales bacterium]